MDEYNGSYDEGIYGAMEGGYAGGYSGGCDEKYGMGGAVAVMLLIAAILLLYYVYVFVGDIAVEKVCGGKDQGCMCDGNEMLTGSRWPSDISEGSLSQVAAGR
jgi:hypothetical protein